MAGSYRDGDLATLVRVRPLRNLPRSRRAVAAVAAVLLLVVLALFWTNRSDTPAGPDEELRIAGAQAPWDAAPVSLDAAVYRPDRSPAPAVILAHGFGGSKDTVAERARQLADAGFLVVAYSARGFGASTGAISVDSLDAEIPDAAAVVDYLATRPDVIADSPGDPRVGVVGGSYGGAAVLMLAGTDQRVDAVVASITWHDLQQALFPSGVSGQPGGFKRQWAGTMLGSVAAAPPPAGLPNDADPDTHPDATGQQSSPDGISTDPGCGRLQRDWCAGYAEVSRTGELTPALAELLARSSPAAVIDQVRAPTLLLQGEADTLFGLDQADANAAALLRHGTTVAVQWFPGGHDGGDLDQRSSQRVDDWLTHYLTGDGSPPGTDFRFAVTSTGGGPARARWFQAPEYPSTQLRSGTEDATDTVPLSGPAQVVTTPVGGLPAAVTSLPGAGPAAAAAESLGGLSVQPAGQSAVFVSEPQQGSRRIAGASRVRVRVTNLGGPPPELFASIGVQRPTTGVGGPAGAETDAMPPGSGPAPMQVAGGQVVPVRLPQLAAGQSQEVTVDLPWVVLRVQDGDRVAVRFATTDQAYASPSVGAWYQLSDPSSLSVPAEVGQPIGTGGVPAWVLIALVVAALAAIGGLWFAGRPRRVPSRPNTPTAAEESDSSAPTLPLSVRGLRKSYGPVHAVREVSFDVRPGRVVGLLGPNGAGKTTTLRMVMGLITPTAGRIEVFGHLVTAGDPVLSRVGSLVEGAGFLPHLSGQANLDLFWRTTGRARDDAHLAEVLDIAGLGAAVQRRVGTYSQGMRQRLAIAQAMLGLPDLLILDEPTNGLDPPQIHAMRTVLRRYAEQGRTVLVSSHLLSEVEQTCDDVVVILRGRTVVAGPVAELTRSSGEMVFAVSDPERATAILSAQPGVAEVSAGDGLVSARTPDPAAAVRRLVGAGVEVSSAQPRHRLEDVFMQLVAAPDLEQESTDAR